MWQITWILNVETTLHTWDKYHFVIIYTYTWLYLTLYSAEGFCYLCLWEMLLHSFHFYFVMSFLVLALGQFLLQRMILWQSIPSVFVCLNKSLFLFMGEKISQGTEFLAIFFFLLTLYSTLLSFCLLGFSGEAGCNSYLWSSVRKVFFSCDFFQDFFFLCIWFLQFENDMDIDSVLGIYPPW